MSLMDSKVLFIYFFISMNDWFNRKMWKVSTENAVSCEPIEERNTNGKFISWSNDK